MHLSKPLNLLTIDVTNKFNGFNIKIFWILNEKVYNNNIVGPATIEFKNNNLEAFKNYCYVIGNLQFLKLSGMYQELCGIELDFIKIINIDIKNIVYKNISQFDIVYIFEKLPENLTHTISKTYSDDFLDSLKTFCEYDYFIYNKCKDTTNNDLQYIINYFT